MNSVKRFVAWVTAALLSLIFPTLVFTADKAYAAPEPVPVDSADLTSGVGLASDSVNGLYWSANADKAVAYGFDKSGKVVRKVTWGAQVKSLQALAFYDGKLYVGDTGDKEAKRSMITVYQLDSLSGGDTGYRAWDFKFPDGKSRDVETMMISARGNVYFVSKEEKGTIYRAKSPISSLSRRSTNELVRVGSAPGWITDGTFQFQNSQMILRSYTAIYTLDAYDFELKGSDKLPSQQAGSGITKSLNGAKAVVFDGGSKPSFVEVELPKSVKDVGVSPSTAPGVSEPSTTPSASPTATETTTSSTAADNANVVVRKVVNKPKSRLTKISLLAAVAAAVSAGLFVAIRPDRKRKTGKSGSARSAELNTGGETEN